MSHCPTCGQKERKARSPQDHRRFFGAIAAAFDQWRHDHEFQPVSAEHLRAWLLCKAGYHKVEMIEIPDALFDDLPQEAQVVILNILESIVHKSVEVALGAEEHAFERPHGGGIAIFKPRSINFETLDQKAFNTLREDVELVIEGELGIPVETLLREHGKAA